MAKGTAYIIPYGFYIRAMFYNKKLFKQAGMADPPATMDDFMEASKKITALGGGKTGYCLRGGPGAYNGWHMMMADMAGTDDYFDNNGNIDLEKARGRGKGCSSWSTCTRTATRQRTASIGASTRSSPASIPAPAPCSTRTPTP